MVTLTRGRERYVTLHFLPLTEHQLSEMMNSTGGAVGATEFAVLTDDDVSLQFLQMVRAGPADGESGVCRW